MISLIDLLFSLSGLVAQLFGSIGLKSRIGSIIKLIICFGLNITNIAWTAIKTSQALDINQTYKQEEIVQKDVINHNVKEYIVLKEEFYMKEFEGKDQCNIYSEQNADFLIFMTEYPYKLLLGTLISWVVFYVILTLVLLILEYRKKSPISQFNLGVLVVYFDYFLMFGFAPTFMINPDENCQTITNVTFGWITLYVFTIIVGAIIFVVFLGLLIYTIKENKEHGLTIIALVLPFVMLLGGLFMLWHIYSVFSSDEKEEERKNIDLIYIIIVFVCLTLGFLFTLSFVAFIIVQIQTGNQYLTIVLGIKVVYDLGVYLYKMQEFNKNDISKVQQEQQ